MTVGRSSTYKDGSLRHKQHPSGRRRSPTKRTRSPAESVDTAYDPDKTAGTSVEISAMTLTGTKPPVPATMLFFYSAARNSTRPLGYRSNWSCTPRRHLHPLRDREPDPIAQPPTERTVGESALNWPKPPTRCSPSRRSTGSTISSRSRQRCRQGFGHAPRRRPPPYRQLGKLAQISVSSKGLTARTVSAVPRRSISL